MGVVQRYELDEQIGVGGMAEIYRARAVAHDGTQLPVVVKRLHPRYSEDADYQQMFENEARIAGVLDHPNIVRILDVGTIDDRLFIAMELVEGRDLQTVLRSARESKREFSAAAALYVTQQVLAALDHAHTRTIDGRPTRIVHRDVTPQNVLVAKNGAVKVTDFGLAKAAIRPGQTVAGVIKGNIRYMAPEQVGAKEVDARTDLYAAGMIFYALIAGKHPFEDEPLVKAISRCITGDVPAPRERAGVTRLLVDTVMKSVATDPALRYQSARAFLEAISRLAGPGEIAAGKEELAKLVQHASLPSALPPSPRAHSIAARLGPLIAEATGGADAAFSIGNKAADVLAAPAPPRSVTIGGHSEPVTALAAFPDGVRVASASGDRSVRIWNIGTRREERALRGHEGAVLCCAVSPNGTLVFSGGRDNRARLWDVASGSMVWVLDSAAPVSSIAFSSRGDLALVGTEDYSAAIWDFGRRKPVMPLDGHRDVVSAALFTPDGRLAITGSYDGLVRVFDAKTGVLKLALEGDSETDSVSALAVSPDGAMLASAGSAAVIRIWDIATGVELRTLIGHRAPVTGLTFASAATLHVLSSSLDGTLREWKNGEQVRRLDAPSAVNAMAAPADLAWALAGADRAVAFFAVS